MNGQATSFDNIGIKNDFMFCTIMRKAEFCKPFLEMVLGISIRELCYAEKQATIDIASRAKSIRLDVYTNDEAGTVYNIEMQVRPREDLPKRARYYQDLIDLNLIDKGYKYSALPNSIVIFVCDFDPFHRGRVLYCYENRLTDGSGEPLGDGTMKVFMNLRGEQRDINGELSVLVRYVNTGETSTSFTQSLDNEVRAVRSNERWRREYMTLQEALDERYQEGQEEGYEKGHAEGREEGHAETVVMIDKVIQRLVADNRTAELPFVAQNLEKYCDEFGLKH